MTVSTTDSEVVYVSGGPAFPIPYRFLQNSDIEAVLVKQDGTSEMLTGAQYTLSGAGSQSGGTLTSAYAAGVLSSPGASLTISRVMDAVQPTDLRNQGKYLAETHENVFDRLTMLVQQGFSFIRRALLKPIGKDYYDAEGSKISNVGDPVQAQDAATMLWAQQYIAAQISSAQGTINNAANVYYLGADGLGHVVQDMSGVNGAGIIGWNGSPVSTWLGARILVTEKRFAGGADPSGVNTSHAAFQAAEVYAGSIGGAQIDVPAGVYKFGQPVTITHNAVTFVGTGRASTRVMGTSTAVASLFKFGAVGGVFRCGLKSMQLDTCAVAVDVGPGSTNTDLEDLLIFANSKAIYNHGDYSTNPVVGNQGTRLNRIEASGYGFAGLHNYCAGELYWDQIVFQGNAFSTGILLDSGSNAVYSFRANLLTNNYGLNIIDATGIPVNPTGIDSTPSQMWFSQLLADTGYSGGIQVSDGFEINFFDCWGSGSQSGSGITIGGNTIEISLIGCRALGNANHGLVLAGANSNSRLKVIGGQFASNGYAATNTYDGINVQGGFSNFTITGANCYNDTGIGLANVQRYGIRIEGGASDNFIITACNNLNNLSGGVNDNSTGVSKQIFGNIPVENNSSLRIAGTAIRAKYSGSTTYDPPSLPSGGTAVTSLTVTGAAVGDVATASFTSITGAGWIIYSTVSSANTVAVTILNMTGSTVDLPSGTLRANVERMS